MDPTTVARWERGLGHPLRYLPDVLGGAYIEILAARSTPDSAVPWGVLGPGSS